MANNNVEIEIQAKLAKIKPLLAFLKKKGKLVGKKRQKDYYFSPEDKEKDFLKVRPVVEWLRLRDARLDSAKRADGKLSVNYKYWHHNKNGRSYFSDEYETEIGSIEQGEKILKALKFRPIATVSKVRQIWNYKDYEIAVDKVKSLGDFVEIEYMSSAKSAFAKKIGDEMIKFLKDLGCGKIELSWQGYPFQLLFPEEVEYEEV